MSTTSISTTIESATSALLEDLRLAGRHVLAAIHGTEPGDDAIVRVAARMATSFGVPLTVISVQSGLSASPGALGTVDTSRIRSRVQQIVTTALSGLSVRPSYQIEITAGDAEREVLSRALPETVAAIVVGRSVGAASGLPPFAYVNSLRSARLCQASRIPVVVVAPVQPEQDPFDRIVIATDFSASSWSAAQTAVRAAAPSATIHVVSVVPNDAFAQDRSYRAAMLDAMGGWVKTLSDFASPRVRWQFDMLVGLPHTAVSAYLDSVHATALAMGAHRYGDNAVMALGYTFPERFLAEWSGAIVSGPCEATE